MVGWFDRCLALAVAGGLSLAAGTAAAQVQDGPSLCTRAREAGWSRAVQANIQGTPLADFCAALREGRLNLSQVRRDPAQAYASYLEALKLAATLEPLLQPRGRDEARIGLALALEQLGQPDEALGLIRLEPAARPFFGRFAESYMLARRGFYDEASAALRQAKQDLPPAYWCTDHDAAAAALAAGRLPDVETSRGVPVALHQGLYTPDGLTPAIGSQCGMFATKGSIAEAGGAFPVTFRFASGQSKVADGKQNQAALKAMVDTIKAYKENYRFTLQGFTDQQCPKGASTPGDCERANLELSRRRAEAAVTMLRTASNDLPAIPVEWFGMERPAIDRPGKPEAANRRVTLVPQPISGATAEKQCPAGVVAYFPDAPQANGRSMSPVVLDAGAAVRKAPSSLLFEIVADPAARVQGADKLYVQAELELGGTSWYADLGAAAGQADPAADKLFATGRLPSTGREPSYFAIDPSLAVPVTKLTVRVISVRGDGGPRRVVFDQTRADPSRFAIEEQDKNHGYQVLRLQRPLALATKGFDGRLTVAALDPRSDDGSVRTKGPRTSRPDQRGAVILDLQQPASPAVAAKPAPAPVVVAPVELQQCEYRFAFAK